MKRIWLLLMAVLTIMVFGACSNKETASDDANATAGNDESSAIVDELNTIMESGTENIGTTIANPLVRATDKDITDKLGIAIDSSVLPNVTGEWIIAGSYVSIEFGTTDTEGQNVDWTLRATKDSNRVENLHGLYYDDFSEAVELTETDGITFFYSDCNGGKIHLYTWEKNGTYYSLSYESEFVSQMQVADALDKIVAAINP